MVDRTCTPSEDEILAALATLFLAADAELLPASAYADLARLRIAIAKAFPPTASPCEPRL